MVATSFINAFNALNQAIDNRVGRNLFTQFGRPKGSYCKPRGNVGCSPVIVGAWEYGSVCKKAKNWIGVENDFYIVGLESAAFTERFNEEYSCCCGGVGCTCGGCCAWFCCIPTFGLSCLFKDTPQRAYEKYVDKHIHDPLKTAICSALGCGNLRKAAKIWQEQFCEPVASLLQGWSRQLSKSSQLLTVNDLEKILTLYGCYDKSDGGFWYQNHFSQRGRTEAYRAVHAFLAGLIRNFQNLNPGVQMFLQKTIQYWDENVTSFKDTTSIPDITIKPIGAYQVEIYQIGQELSFSMADTAWGRRLEGICREIDRRNQQAIIAYQQGRAQQIADTNLATARSLEMTAASLNRH